MKDIDTTFCHQIQDHTSHASAAEVILMFFLFLLLNIASIGYPR